MNPLLYPSSLPFGLPDYAAITDLDFKEAIEAGLERQRAVLNAIASEAAPPTVSNTVEAWELSSDLLDRAVQAWWVAKAADTNPERDAIEADLAPKLAEHRDAIWLNRRLYDRLVSLRVRADEGQVILDEETGFWLSERLREFKRNGILLDSSSQDRLRQLNSELASLSVAFEQALVEGRNAAAVHVTDATELTGLEPAVVERARHAAEARGIGGWLIELINTTGQPVLESLSNRDLRRRIFEASVSRGLGGDYDVRQLVLDIVRRRAERAQLLGYEHHAAWVAAGGCARTTQAVMNLLTQVVPGAMELARRETEQLQTELSTDHPGAQLEPWDWEYYAAKLAASTAVDPAELKPYLEYHKVLHDGVFAAATALFGLTFHRREDLRGFTAESTVYEVREADGTPLGAFIIDPYTRDSKRGGAWMTSICLQSRLTGIAPVVTNTCNFQRPADGSPSLLTWDNVITLFHEFGHALHGLLSDVTYPSLSGTAVPTDFVEFPSQVNELWAWNEELLARYAVHHITGEPLPAPLMSKLRASQRQGQGYATVEATAAMLLDQAWHSLTPDEVPNSVDELEAFESASLERHGVAHPLVPPRYRSGYFSHVFGSMYAASYYGYLWAEVLDADACAWFAEHGGLTPEAGEHYRRQLVGRGGSIEAMTSWARFRGADPDVSHLLRRKGLDQ